MRAELRSRAFLLVVAVAVVLAAGQGLCAAAPAPGTALLSYLSAVNSARAPYLVAGPAVDTALQKVSGTPDSTWTVAAAKAKAAARAAAHLESSVAALDPPPGLATANAAFVKSAALAAGILNQLGSALAAKNVSAVNAAVAKVNATTPRIDSLEKSWKTAVAAAAHADKVAVPQWVTTMGS